MIALAFLMVCLGLGNIGINNTMVFVSVLGFCASLGVGIENMRYG